MGECPREEKTLADDLREGKLVTRLEVLRKVLRKKCTDNRTKSHLLFVILGFPGGSDSKESACSARGPGLTSGSGRSLRERNGNPLQYSCLENPTDKGAGRATAHGVTKSQT